METHLESSTNGRPIKFTPERLEQVRNLIERGHSREEVAAIIGSTVGSLQVTCSKHGISLRRPVGAMAPKPPKPPTIPKAEFVGLPRPPAPDGKKYTVSLVLEYNGRSRKTPLELTQTELIWLAFEADSKQLKMGELLVELIKSGLPKK